MRVVLFLAGLVLTPTSVCAQFAEPPADPLLVESFEPVESLRPTTSSTRLHVGPAIDLADADAGLFAAIDVGRDRVGGRLSGTAIAFGAPRGSALASAELWVCPLEFGRWRALLGAGAGLRDESPSQNSDANSRLTGVAVLRGGLELALPVPEADARLAASVAALVPAIVEHGAAKPSGLAVMSLALGL